MSPYFSKNSFILSIIIFLQIQSVVLQVRAPTKRPVLRKYQQMCEQYKSKVYEKVYTFSSLVIGAPEIRNVVSNCKPSSPFILGGTNARPKEFPHMARLGYTQDGSSTNWFCGGTLISNRFVLTAAHCFHGPDEVNLVRLGELNFDSNEDDALPADYSVRRYIDYPRYDNAYDYHDIGLVELNNVVEFSEYVVPACLPSSSGNEYSRFLAAGWGSTDLFRSNENHLMKVTLDRFSDPSCNELASRSSNLPYGINEITQICAGSSERKDTCTGDSGGPLLQYHNEFKCMFQVVGVTSIGIGGCGTPNLPGVYTRVYSYINWIESIVW